MKAFVLKEPGVVGYEQVPEPVLTPYGAILKPVAVAPCSSDVHTVFGGGSSMHQHHFQVISLDAHSQVSFQSVFLFQMLIRHWRKFQRVLA